ncbi:MAG: GNAT family N-acetyltransferase [Ardenticatenaceae bacterium]|nr:GNAT family N-acetyltransferase [Ardenticatenaceae bacterium]
MIITETKRLLLRQFHAFDSDAMERVFGDAEVMRFGPGVQSKAWVRDWLRWCREENYQKLGFGPWAVVAKDLGQVIGYCGLFYFADIDGRSEIEMGYRLARSFWGCGYATEAVTAVRDYAFTILCLPRLVALIDPQNTASLRVAAKAGMYYEKDMMLEGYTHPDLLVVIESPIYK